MSTLTGVERLPVTGSARAAGVASRRLLLVGAIAIVSTALLLWTALWNGYPFLFFDSFLYIGDAFEALPAREKALSYGLLIGLFKMMHSLWPIVILQAAATHYLLGCLWRARGFGGGAGARLALLALLVIGTPLSWVVSHVMPDIFTALLIVSLYLLVFARGDLGPTDRFIVPALFVLSNTVHNSNCLLSGLLVAGVSIGAWMWKWVPFRRLLYPLALIGAAMAVMVGLNWVRSGQLFLARGGKTYLASRMAEDGIMQRLMSEHCGEKHYALCRFGPIPTERQFLLFNPKSPLNEIGGWIGAEPEMTRMIVDALRFYPKENLLAALSQIGNQLRSFELAESIFPFGDNQGASGEIRAYFPAEYRNYQNSRQQLGTIASSGMATLHAVVVWIGAFLSVLWSWRLTGKARMDIRSLIAFVWIGLIGNAAVCGIFSHYEFRYQARVVWLAPLCAFLAWSAMRAQKQTPA